MEEQASWSRTRDVARHAMAAGTSLGMVPLCCAEGGWGGRFVVSKVDETVREERSVRRAMRLVVCILIEKRLSLAGAADEEP